jgi:hypothetical protein
MNNFDFEEYALLSKNLNEFLDKSSSQRKMRDKEHEKLWAKMSEWENFKIRS